MAEPGGPVCFGVEDLIEQSVQRTVHGMAVSVLTLEALISTKQSANRARDRAVLDLLRDTLALRIEQSDR
jgi:hypothetical protein